MRRRRRFNRWKAKAARASRIGRARAKAHWRIKHEWMRTREVDADTVRFRERDSARGQTIRWGADYRADKTRHWIIRRSIDGRLNQVDVVINGVVWRIGALVHAEYAIKRGHWPRWAKRQPKELKAAA